MNRTLFATVAAGLILAASQASAASTIFTLDGTLANSGTSSAVLTNNGATLTGTGIEFGANAGPTITGLGVLTEYSLETRFRFDEVSGYRKIADFFDRSSDSGFYVRSGDLNFYPIAFLSTNLIAPNTMITAKLTRGSTGTVEGFLNGVFQFSFDDSSSQLAVINDTLHMFRDDFATSQNEASAGYVDYIALNGTVGGAVPEPAAWALMIGGFGLAGASLRRRRAMQAA
jgi:PEP-CTERM motif